MTATSEVHTDDIGDLVSAVQADAANPLLRVIAATARVERSVATEKRFHRLHDPPTRSIMSGTVPDFPPP